MPRESHLKVFGSVAVSLDKRPKGNFTPRGKKYIMVGYSETSKGYKETRSLLVNRYVYFLEEIVENKNHIAFPVNAETMSEKNNDLDTNPQAAINSNANNVSGRDYDSFDEESKPEVAATTNSSDWQSRNTKKNQ